MPELPEVETMVRGLRPALVGQMISKLLVLDPFLLQHCEADVLQQRGQGASVASVSRRGKWVVLTLDKLLGVIVIQPRMTGGFWLIPPDRPEHVRMRLDLHGSGGTVWFCDARRLGKIALFDTTEEAESAFARSHGPDATEIDRRTLEHRLKRTGRAIKPAIMDQKVVAGIGNIYADESLFRARIHPERRANTLKSADFGRLHSAIGTVLAEAIAAEGSSFDAGYRTVLGLEGGFLAINSMYGRGGQPCPDCSTPVVKTRIVGLAGRPTHFCPKCQPYKQLRTRKRF